MSDEIRRGVVLPTGLAQWGAGAGARDVVRFAARAEELGLDSVWAGDTLLRPVLEPLAVLSAVAAVTDRIGLGTATLLPVLRRPVQAAAALASLDLLSAGRLTVAVGAGFPGRSEVEHALSGVPWPARFARLDDTVALWRHLWTTDGPTSYSGPVHRFADIPSTTPPARPGGPPVWLGGASPAALARTGRHYDGWLPYPPDPDDYRAGLAAARAAATAAGRDPAAITPALFVTVLITDDPRAGRRALEEYALASYRMPVELVEKVQLLVAGPVAEVREVLDRYVAAGARHLVFRIGALDLRTQLAQLELLAQRALPAAP
jgi:alkanesulfonate monooxygenase SsuD/methylene tetrahydromethanopterin reductase-like flavin-dependent oxidoreductase (luciferase family)